MKNITKRLGLAVAVLGLMATAAGQANAGLVIDTYSSIIGHFDSLGESSVGPSTFGQTFTVGTDTILDKFSFSLNDFVDPDTIDFAGYVMKWDPSTSKAVGPVLYESDMKTTTNNGGSDGYERFDFATGGLTLEAGQNYVAFLSASKFFDGVIGDGSMPIAAGNSYPGGSFVYLSNGSDFSLLTTSTWTVRTFDAAFRAEFSSPVVSAVPEPSTIALVFTALPMGLGFAWKRRRKAVTA
ncbi:PEP-CTERM protein-sorting domain-containing protein [Singulisphaera sp. GP187]|uniref:PEP-CTERM sorting domain-containing protein n=1 Tax=Singulisphaera sp. GP187 TaxID=1882752 RepID=UPI0009267457|nr:PEP-CTERM sorting domain-containing protein [Singulisphaera sp. GP187]SIN69197.1 PEP-CTERM protein-sorting domain-containing protein [Singulisphaera sp. GP187]